MNLRQGQKKKRMKKEKDFLIEFDKEMKNRGVLDEGNLRRHISGR